MNKRDLILEQVRVTRQILDARLGRQIDKYYASEENRKAYAAHLSIFSAGKKFRERAALGGNRVGKSVLGAFETSCHLTGQYPSWWKGYRFTKPITAWAAGETLAASRDIVQSKLLGEPHCLGQGMIPRDSILDIRKKSGVPDGVDSVRVRHVSGGVSTLQFMAYQAGREAFQGRRVSFCWLDEEPPMPVYGETLMRTAATSKAELPGRVLITCTPMLGLSDVMNLFLIDGRLSESGDRYGQQIAWSDIPHLSEAEQKELLASIPKYQRDARSKGFPSLGAGAVYSYNEDSLICEPLKHIPRYWLRGYGMDVGWRATAAVFVAQDPDTGMTYVVDEYLQGETPPVENAVNISLKAGTAWGPMTGCIDPSARQRSQQDGRRLLDQYRQQRLKLVTAENAVESGINRIQNLMDLSQLKIYPRCTSLMGELRRYSRDENGKIRKQHDHLLDSLRYVLNTPRALGRPRPPGWKPRVIKSM